MTRWSGKEKPARHSLPGEDTQVYRPLWTDLEPPCQYCGRPVSRNSDSPERPWWLVMGGVYPDRCRARRRFGSVRLAGRHDPFPDRRRVSSAADIVVWFVIVALSALTIGCFAMLGAKILGALWR